jgi:hypothetical protein
MIWSPNHVAQRLRIVVLSEVIREPLGGRTRSNF